MLILYGCGDKILFAHEKFGLIRSYNIDKNLGRKAFTFNDSTTVRVSQTPRAFAMEVLRQGECFVSVQSNLEEYNGDVLYMGTNTKWLIFGEIDLRGDKWV